MKISYNWLQEFFPKKLPSPEKLAEELTLHAFEVEGVERIGNDWILDIDVLPNRGYDCLSHWGIAREVSALLNISLRVPFRTSLGKVSRLPLSGYLRLEVKDTALCGRYTATLFMNVKVGPSPLPIRERLNACGIRAINNVVDATNYVMLEMGQPLHAFDFDKVEDGNSKFQVPRSKPKEIIVRRAKNGEQLNALDGNRYELDDSMLVIADSSKALALAGIIGGEESAIDEGTTSVLIESANFDRKSVYATAKKLGIRTDSSLRFGHGLDPELAPVAQARVEELLREWAGARKVGGMLDIYPHKRKPVFVRFEKARAERLLGVSIPDASVRTLFKRLGFFAEKSARGIFRVEIPTFRNDIALNEDLAEEIGRLMGYENIPARFPHAPLATVPVSDVALWADHTRRAFEHAGFIELYGYSFVSGSLLEKGRWDIETCVPLENPVSREYEYLRPHLLLKMLEGVGAAKHITRPLRFFELGKVFSRDGEVVRERSMLGALIILPQKDQEAFFEMKGVVTALLERMGMSHIWFDGAGQMPVASPKIFWHPVRSAEVKVGQDGETIGFMGEISPMVLEEFKIKERVAACEFDFETLAREATEEKEYKPIPKYPALVRDIAVLVPTSVLAENVEALIHSVGKELVVDTDLFDIYEGKGIPEGMKNLAYHIVYQAEERTLSEKEVDRLHKMIEDTMRKNGWEVR